MGSGILDNLRRRRATLAGAALLLLGAALQVITHSVLVQGLGFVILLAGLWLIRRDSRLDRSQKASATRVGIAVASFTAVVVVMVVFLDLREPYATLATIGGAILASGAAVYWLSRNRRKTVSDKE